MAKNTYEMIRFQHKAPQLLPCEQAQFATHVREQDDGTSWTYTTEVNQATVGCQMAPTTGDPLTTEINIKAHRSNHKPLSAEP